MTPSPGHNALHEADDPWARDWDYAARCQLAQSILGHADETCWQLQIQRAIRALQGASIEQITEETWPESAR